MYIRYTGTVGAIDGLAVLGVVVGAMDVVGNIEEAVDGIPVGTMLGNDVGGEVGTALGRIVGARLGETDGPSLGNTLGMALLGVALGKSVDAKSARTVWIPAPF